MWLLIGPSAPETTRVATTTAALSTMTATEAGATTTLQRLEQDLKRVQSEIDACNKELKEADFDRMLQQYTRELAEHNRELAEHNRELNIVKDILAELEAAAEELEALPQGDSERQAAIRKNKLDQKKQENRRAGLQSAIARSEAAIARSEAAIIRSEANQKDVRRDLAAKRQSIYDQLKRLDDTEKRIREQMEKAAAQTGQLSFPVTRTTPWYHHSVRLTCAPEICLVA